MCNIIRYRWAGARRPGSAASGRAGGDTLFQDQICWESLGIALGRPELWQGQAEVMVAPGPVAADLLGTVSEMAPADKGLHGFENLNA